jgi:hypothetical protein
MASGKAWLAGPQNPRTAQKPNDWAGLSLNPKTHPRAASVGKEFEPKGLLAASGKNRTVRHDAGKIAWKVFELFL